MSSREHITVNLPPTFDASKHLNRLVRAITEQHGEGFEVTNIDPVNNVAHAVRTVAITEVTDDAKGDAKRVDLMRGTKPSDGEKLAVKLADQYPGFEMVRFEPHLSYAELRKLDPETSRCRSAIATAISVKPWLVEVVPTKEGGFNIALPDSYMPSKHNDKLEEVTTDIVGAIGWWIDIDPASLKAVMHPGQPPTFPKIISYDFERTPPLFDPREDEWANIPVGWKLPAPGVDDYDVLTTDFASSAHCQLSGLSGGGKAQPLHTLIPVPLGERFTTGYALLGELQPGDLVYSADGTQTPVVALSETTQRPIITLTFDDGQEIAAADDHLWTVSAPEQRRRISDDIRIASTLADSDRQVTASLDAIAKLIDISVEELRTVVGEPAIDTTLRYLVDKELMVYLDRLSPIALWDLPDDTLLDVPGIVNLFYSSHPSRDALTSLLEDVLPVVRIPSRLQPGKSGDTGVPSLFNVCDALETLQQERERFRRSNEDSLYQTVTTRHLLDHMDKSGDRWAVPVASAIANDEADLPIAPYVLGICLSARSGGDFAIRCDTDNDLQAVTETLTSHGCKVSTDAASLCVVIEDGETIQFIAGNDSASAGLIPTIYQRASAAQRLAFLQGIVDAIGVFATNGSCRIPTANSSHTLDVLLLVRSLGIKAKSEHDGLTFKTTLPVSRLPSHIADIPKSVEAAQSWHYIVEAVESAPMPVRCLSIAHPSDLYLTGDYIPTHNSVTLVSLIAGGLARGWELVILDPIKGGVDFIEFEEFCRPGGWGCEGLTEAVCALTMAYNEGLRRKKLIKEHRVQKWTQLPVELGIRPIMVVSDEVSSLLTLEPVPKLGKENPLVLEIQERNLLRSTALNYLGRIARELRFVGVSLVISSQVSSTTTGVPTEMRTNLGMKAQPLLSRVPVPISEKFKDGWATIGDLEVGDHVFAVDGSAATVTGLTPVMERPVYGVHFDDGQVIETDEGHLWEVSTRASRSADTPTGALRSIERTADMERRIDVVESAFASNTATECSLKECAIESDLTKDYLERIALDADLAYRVTPFKTDQGTNLATATRDVLHFLAGDVASLDVSTGLLSQARKAASAMDADSWVSIKDLLADVNPNSFGFVTGKLRPLCRHKVLQVTTSVVRPNGPRHHRRYDRAALYGAILADLEGRPVYSNASQIVTTLEMAHNTRSPNGLCQYAIDLPAPIDTPEMDLPVDPYVLGAWLGDGSKHNGEIAQGTSQDCTDDDGITDQQHMIDQLRAAGYETYPKPSSPDRVVSTRGLQVDLRKAGVLLNKHIPPEYLRASVDQRLALLQGLMDTDGHVNKHGHCIFCSVRPELADGFVELVRSLGIKVSVATYPSIIGLTDPETGEKYRKKTGTTCYIPRFTTTLPVCRLPRKAKRLPVDTASGRSRRLFVTEVKPAGVEMVRCIEIDHPRHLYLTGGFVPTHNCLLGAKPTDNNRRLALSSPDSVPEVPDYLTADAAVVRGVGVYEFEGHTPGVFKGFFADPIDFANWLKKIGVTMTDRPRPTAAEIAKHTPSLDDQYQAKVVERRPSDVADRGGMTARTGSSVSDAFKPTTMCNTCDSPIDPLTGECLCSK